MNISFNVSITANQSVFFNKNKLPGRINKDGLCLTEENMNKYQGIYDSNIKELKSYYVKKPLSGRAYWLNPINVGKELYYMFRRIYNYKSIKSFSECNTFIKDVQFKFNIEKQKAEEADAEKPDPAVNTTGSEESDTEEVNPDPATDTEDTTDTEESNPIAAATDTEDTTDTEESNPIAAATDTEDTTDTEESNPNTAALGSEESDFETDESDFEVEAPKEANLDICQLETLTRNNLSLVKERRALKRSKENEKIADLLTRMKLAMDCHDRSYKDIVKSVEKHAREQGAKQVKEFRQSHLELRRSYSKLNKRAIRIQEEMDKRRYCLERYI